jgi:hypothetical protein
MTQWLSEAALLGDTFAPFWTAFSQRHAQLSTILLEDWQRLAQTMRNVSSPRETDLNDI